LRDHRIVIADDSGKQRLAPLQLADQVIAKLIFDTTGREAIFGKIALAQCA
jgi:hypothetical protein